MTDPITCAHPTDRSLGSRGRGPFAAIVALALAHPACRAGTSAPFDLDGLAFVLLGAVFLVFVAIGRSKGAIAFAVLMAGLFAWGRWETFGNGRATARADTAYATRCYASATDTAAKFTAVPDRVIVRADPALRPGQGNAVRLSLPETFFAPGSEAFAVPRVPGAAYVDIALLHEPIEGAGPRFLDGVRATVSDAAGRVVAERTDYFGNPGWCLGDAPPESIEKFLIEVLGRPVGLAALGEREADRLPVRALRATVSAVQRGRFHDETLRRPGGREAEAKRVLALLPPEAGCRLDDRNAFDAVLLCAPGTPQQNTLAIADLAAVHRTPDGWLSLAIEPTGARQFDALGIVERSSSGAVRRRWQVRVPPVTLEDDDGRVAVRGVAWRHGVLTAEVVFARQLGAGDAQQTPAWYERKVDLTVPLAPGP